jgi:polyketide-type polyunsaturated fatty acid synthase PfaA
MTRTSTMKKERSKGGLRDIPVAIIGLASIFPEAHNLQEYWDNIVNKVNCIIDVPPSRWKLEDYYDPDPSVPDKTYCKRGGFIPDIDFDPMEFGLPPNILEVTDVSQLLSLVIARDALEDAGYSDSAEWDRDKTGVILGMVGMSAKTFVPLMNRLQYPIWERVLLASGVSQPDVQKITEKIKKAYINWEENSFPGTLANVVAGRIANRFDLGGINCVIDAACASSLSAIKMSVEELVTYQTDMMITGGVDTDNTISTFMSFSKTPAFTKGEVVQTFDADSAGMMIGEGIGMIVLKRLEDAERDGNRIYAVIRGIGSSSDGRFKSIYAPRPAGQAKALKRAYEEAGYSPATVGLVEAHGTGTAAGDPAEVQGLREIFGENNPRRQYIALGSVKSQIGHTKATAGAASMIKTALALYNKVLPPTLNVTKPNPKLELENSPFYINTDTRPWFRADLSVPRRAGVSSFGFGGTNFHVALEEYQPEQQKAYRINRVAEPVLISAPTQAQLISDCQETLAGLKSESAAVNFQALTTASRTAVIPSDQARIGFVADSAKEAIEMLQAAIDGLKAQPQAEAWDNPKGIYFRKTGIDPQGKVVALFPGQGSQYLEMGKELALNFPTIRQVYEGFDALFAAESSELLSGKVFPRPVFDPKEREKQSETLQKTENAQPAIGAFSVGLFTILKQAGLAPDFTAGHSFGEWTALWAAGVLSDEDYFKAAKARGQAMAAPDDPNFDAGTMLAVKGDVEKIREELKAFPDITLANFNSNNQVALAGSKVAVAKVQQVLAEKGFSVVPLQVSAAFHTPLVGHAQKPFAKALKALEFRKPALKVFSNSTGVQHLDDSEAIRKVMVDHILNPVLFRDEIDAIYAAGGRIFIECGPKNVLTNLVDNILGDRPHVTVALNGSAKKDSDRQLREAAIRLKVVGLPLGDIDPYETPRKVSAPKKKSPVSVTLNGGFYTSEKTRKAYEDALVDGWKVSQAAAPEPVVIEKFIKVPVPAADVPSPVLQPAQAGSSALDTLEQILTQFQDRQSESLHIHEQYLQNDAEYARIFSQLTQAELGVVTSSPNAAGLQALESLERSMMRFHDHQSDTLKIHEQYLRSQEEFGRNFVSLVQQQMDLLRNSPQQAPVQPRLSVPAPAPAPVNVTLPTPQPVAAEKSVKPEPAAKTSSNGSNGNDKPVEVKAPEKVVSAQPAAPAADFSGELLKIVSDKTGYPQEMLDLNMDMEADLGIDSIKRVEILGALQQAMPDLPKPEPETLAEMRTLQHIITFLGAGSPAAAPVAPVLQAAAPAAVAAPAQVSTVAVQSVPAGDLTDTLIKVVSEKTGYPKEMLDLNMNMEADLGIDSIKRVEILGALQQEYPDLPKPEPEALAELATLSQIIAFMQTGPSAVSTAIPAVPVVESNPVVQPEPQPAVQPTAKVPQPAPALPVSSGDLKEAVLQVVSEKTGYPQEMLDLAMDMEADLGIDSIKRVEILGALQAKYPDLPKPEPEALAEMRTLGHIIDFLAKPEVAVVPAETPRPFA